jgi:hypothetical protein
VAEASRGLPSVKAFVPPADDEIVTSVAFSAPTVPEVVSPELALIDSALGERLRAHLPEPADALAPRTASARPLEAESPTRAAPAGSTELDLEPDGEVPAASDAGPASLGDPMPPAEADRTSRADLPNPLITPASVPSNVRPLRPAVAAEVSDAAAIEVGTSAGELVSRAQPEVETRRVPSVQIASPAPTVERLFTDGSGGDVIAPVAPRPLVARPRWNGTATRRMLVAFAGGAVAASFVVVGVIAALGESGGGQAAVADGSTPSLAPPVVAAAAPQPTAPSPSTGTSSNRATSKKAPSATKNGSAASSKKATATAKKKATGAKQTKTPDKSGAATPAATVPARRFAWAPVEGAVGYRVELFRGDAQVLRATTKQPFYELRSAWRHQGHAERLSPGAYRWYVWPVLPSGQAAGEAVVQAKLTVP